MKKVELFKSLNSKYVYHRSIRFFEGQDIRTQDVRTLRENFEYPLLTVISEKVLLTLLCTSGKSEMQGVVQGW